jgi:hypothetical protein
VPGGDEILGIVGSSGEILEVGEVLEVDWLVVEDFVVEGS